MDEISLEKVNRFLLKKQHLSEDSKLDNILQIVKDIGGLHATSATTPYLSLYARMHNFLKQQLDDEIYTKRNLGKVRFVRTTMYLLPKEIIPVAFSAMERTIKPISQQYMKRLGIPIKEYKKLSNLILKTLKGKGMTTKELKNILDTKFNVSAILNLMCDSGLLLRETMQNSWKSNLHTYYPFNEYFPEVKLGALDEAAAKEMVIKQYITSFGPVTLTDISWWTGFAKHDSRGIMKKLEDQTTQVEIADLDEGYYLLDSDLRSLKKLKLKEQNEINLLPLLDPYLMGYKDRDRYLNIKDYNYIFDRSGNATTTILNNGRIIGIWDISEKPEPIVKLYFFDEVEKGLLNEIKKKGKQLGKFILDSEVKVKVCSSMVPLNERTAGSMMTPLKGF